MPDPLCCLLRLACPGLAVRLCCAAPGQSTPQELVGVDFRMCFHDSWLFQGLGIRSQGLFPREIACWGLGARPFDSTSGCQSSKKA